MCAKKFLTKGMDFPGYESSETEPPTAGQVAPKGLRGQRHITQDDC